MGAEDTAEEKKKMFLWVFHDITGLVCFQDIQRIPNFNLLNIIFTYHLHSLVHLITDDCFEEKWTKESLLLFISHQSKVAR